MTFFQGNCRTISTPDNRDAQKKGFLQNSVEVQRENAE